MKQFDAKIKRLQAIEPYVSPSWLVEPVLGTKPITRPNKIKEILSQGYRVAEPVMGWGPYTHLIEIDSNEDFIREGWWYLAQVVED